MTQLFPNLNEPQLDAVETLEGPVLVLAGAGSGKTRVVTYRIINLLQHGRSASSILGLTFTNKAANEMKERVKLLTQHQVLICTFHSLGARILRESISALGYDRNFTIYDDADTDTVLTNCLVDLGVYDAKKGAKAYRSMISQSKNDMHLPEEASAHLISDLPRFVDVYAAYQHKLKEYNALDFDDLLFLPVRLLREHPAILHSYQERWPYLLIDEYQDTNEAQYKLIKLLAGSKQNICAVGDPDQSIYSWRGAKIRNILNFEEDFSGAKMIRLEQNYRSRSNILNAANAVIERNQSRIEKHLWSDKGPGEKIKYFVADNETHEAEFVANQVFYHHQKHRIPLSQMVVFYRTNAQSRVFEDYFLKWRIPYAIVGGLSFYQRREIKDILAFLRVILTGSDFVAFSRTINLPKRGLGESSIEKIRHYAFQSNLTVLAYCEALAKNEPIEPSLRLNSKQREGLKEYIQIIHQLREIASSCSLMQLVKSTIELSGYLGFLQEDSESYDDRKANLDALIAKAYEWEKTTPEPALSKFLEELSLKSTLDEVEASKQHVSLMTIHNGKGLEFEVAFLVGLEQDLFPHVNSRDNEDKIEEERRLFYVGMTRAKEFLYLTHARSRFMWGTTRFQSMSGFLREIPLQYVEKMRSGSSVGSIDLEETEPMNSSQEACHGEMMKTGDCVFHHDFGVGTISDVYEGSVGSMYKIFFTNDNKERTLAVQHCKLVKL